MRVLTYTSEACKIRRHQRGHLRLFAPVGGDLLAAPVADHPVGPVPRLHDVQAFLDLALQVAAEQVTGDKDCFLGAADL